MIATGVLFRRALPFLLAGGIWMVPVPAGLTAQAWHLFAVFVASIAAVLGSWLGARFTAGKVKSATLSRIFAIALIALAVQRAWILLA